MTTISGIVSLDNRVSEHCMRDKERNSSYAHIPSSKEAVLQKISIIDLKICVEILNIQVMFVWLDIFDFR